MNDPKVAKLWQALGVDAKVDKLLGELAKM
jgi:hypothetical protein